MQVDDTPQHTAEVIDLLGRPPRVKATPEEIQKHIAFLKAFEKGSRDAQAERDTCDGIAEQLENHYGLAQAFANQLHDSAIHYRERAEAANEACLSMGRAQAKIHQLLGEHFYITPAQADILHQRIQGTGTDIANFCGHYKIDSLREMPVQHYDDAISKLDRKAKRRAA